MAELLLSAFLQVLFDRLASRELLNFVCQPQRRFDSELNNWGDSLRLIKAVLKDAEEKELTNKAVKFWLDELRDLAYDAEDILDEFATEALKHKLKEDPDHPSTSKIRSFLSDGYFNPRTAKFNMDMKSKIESMTNRFRKLCEQRTGLGLQATSGGTSTAATALNRPPSSSVPTERAVYGRNEDKAKILEMVLSDVPSDACFRVIPIVGTGGAGKTTLAREVYNDRAVEDFKFDIKAWICVSDVFDVPSISKTILSKINSNPCDEKDFDQVQVELKKAVQGKKFLLVLDDVWNEDYSLWQKLIAPFRHGAPNSKIILTTRQANVALTMGSTEHHNLKHLSEEACWSVFMMHAIEGTDINTHHQVLELFRKKVVSKCGGLPLTAEILGGLLRSKRVDAWDDILNSNILDLSQHTSILPALRLSYQYLPSHLKRCFAYCGIFPKDYEFEKNELILLWMAEHIIQRPINVNKQLEDWGNECFDELLSRSIFQQSSGDSSKFVMHDLVHDLAQFVSGETIFRSEDANKKLPRSPERVRHSSYTHRQYDSKNKFELFNKLEHLRTFLPVSTRGNIVPHYISNVVLFDLLPKLKKLRVLSLVGYYITELPDSIKGLRLLSYLNLSGTKIRSLPESTSSLLNLQILKLRDCNRLMKLPTKMRKLINLCYLDIEGTNLLKEMPSGMMELKHLQRLSNFVVGKGIGSSLKDLKHLKFLCGELCISKLENVNDPRDATEAILCEKLNLGALVLVWNQFNDSRHEDVNRIVLEALQPHKNIKRLAIKNYSGARFPSWIGDASFSKIEVLELENCEYCMSLPSLGFLDSLKQLKIRRMRGLKRIDSDIYGKGCSIPFQSLEFLHFENLEEWEYWDIDIKENEHVKIFPLLRELSIKKCPKLSGKLPELLPSLETLVVSECAELVVSVSSFPKLSRFEINECKGLQMCNTPINSKLIKSRTISSRSVEIYGCEGMLYNSSTDDSLKSVIISNFLEFEKFLKQGFQIVDTLGIGNTEKVKSWKEWGVAYKKPIQGLHIFIDHGEVSIKENCSSLISFPEVNLPLHNIRFLGIEKCRALKSLPEELMGNNSQLENLSIEHCDSLKFIARCKLPPTLKTLEVWFCQNLQHLVVDEEDASSSSSSSSTLKELRILNCHELTTLSSGIQLLEHLRISNCPKLESIPDGLHNLKEIYIDDCSKLESIPDGLHNLKEIYINVCSKLGSIPDGLHNLKGIGIHKCTSLVSLLEGGLPNTISSVSIRGCEKLKALPNYMHKLDSLQYLYVGELPSVASFPEEGFPNNLTSLTIEDREIYKGFIHWGLHRLTSLRRLYISGCHEAESFPDEEVGMMLPTSLTYLSIGNLPKLKYLSNSTSMGFQHLTSLESLIIPNCPNLASFPKVGLPSTLLELYIKNCPLLKKGCKRGKGKEWSKISHIPCVKIDGKFIYDA